MIQFTQDERGFLEILDGDVSQVRRVAGEVLDPYDTIARMKDDGCGRAVFPIDSPARKIFEAEGLKIRPGFYSGELVAEYDE